MKRCWLARYWGLAVQYGNSSLGPYQLLLTKDQHIKKEIYYLFKTLCWSHGICGLEIWVFKWYLCSLYSNSYALLPMFVTPIRTVTSLPFLTCQSISASSKLILVILQAYIQTSLCQNMNTGLHLLLFPLSMWRLLDWELRMDLIEMASYRPYDF